MLPIRNCVQKTPGYVPGEQPQTTDYIKLNTNENPYSPPDAIFNNLEKELKKVRLYPDPVSTKLRQAAGEVFGFSHEQILAGNGSDDILNIALRTFVNPGETVAFLDPTYSLYETITKVHGANIKTISTNDNFELNSPLVCPDAKLIFVASPNPPLGKHLNRKYLQETCEQATGIVLIDEAYVDFSDENHWDFIKQYNNVIISRTMSKSYSLAGMRVGFGVSSVEIINQMNKVRDSYNLDRIAQMLGANCFQFQDYFQGIWQQVRNTRHHLITSLRNLDFFVFDSDANFVLASPQWIEASDLYTKLKERKVLIRYFKHPRISNYIRITVGTDAEIDRLLKVIKQLKNES